MAMSSTPNGRPDETVIGHSMGGLVARKALEADGRDQRRRDDANIQLVTVSAPLAGIKAASTCGVRQLHWLSLGTLPGLCWISWRFARTRACSHPRHRAAARRSSTCWQSFTEQQRQGQATKAVGL